MRANKINLYNNLFELVRDVKKYPKDYVQYIMMCEWNASRHNKVILQYDIQFIIDNILFNEMDIYKNKPSGGIIVSSIEELLYILDSRYSYVLESMCRTFMENVDECLIVEFN